MGKVLPQTDPSLPSEVSPLFSDTTAARGDHMRANNSAIWENLNFLLPAMDTFNYDLVVDSNAKFLAWQSGTYEHVLIKTGTWTLASGGIDLTARGTKTITGESGSLLVFTDVGETLNGLYYTTAPETNDYWMQNVSIDVTGIIAGTVSGFKNCYNLTQCSSVTTANNSSGYGHGHGFNTCFNLINCIGTGDSTTGTGQGFSSCSSLINCIGSGSSTSGSGYGFKDSINLSHCIGVGIGTGSTGTGAGFSTCDNLSNCTGEGTGGGTSGQGYGFVSCNNLFACAGTGTGGSTTGTGYGFFGCIKLSDCTGLGTGGATGDGHGFNSCYKLSNCIGTGAGGGTSGAGYGFSACTGIIGCAGAGTAAGSGVGYGFYGCKKCCENSASAASKTATYNTSYADAGTAATCADTAAGGWNS